MVVKREDVMRDDLTFHVFRITPVANSANIADTDENLQANLVRAAKAVKRDA